jgi:hypothetical protein
MAFRTAKGRSAVRREVDPEKSAECGVYMGTSLIRKCPPPRSTLKRVEGNAFEGRFVDGIPHGEGQVCLCTRTTAHFCEVCILDAHGLLEHTSLGWEHRHEAKTNVYYQQKMCIIKTMCIINQKCVLSTKQMCIIKKMCIINPVLS